MRAVVCAPSSDEDDDEHELSRDGDVLVVRVFVRAHHWGKQQDVIAM